MRTRNLHPSAPPRGGRLRKPSKLRTNTVEIRDLYRIGWNPEVGLNNFRHELVGHFKPQVEQVRAVNHGTFAPDVAAEIEEVQRADLLVFSCPMWWFSLPALLKGGVDRVFTMGVVYGGSVGRFETGGARAAGQAALHDRQY
ncbi:NAD(P)H-dependent oxidoreductase [Deinococcus taeanensis]|uniref:NAD(P)H-dependent oxidoreductase n=1 Tax=Deinococcus taeanensis TaxID=2737050 RepID=UPI00210523B0|nr:NAD(P)H-dependent oxidoreductase [Deinococcus taeanensis]